MSPRLKLLPAAIACSLVSTVTPHMAQAEGLGVIQVESTTIDDKFDNKREEASSISVISGEAVDEGHVQNVMQVLKKVPGLTTQFESGDRLKIMMRGVENQRYMGEKPGVAVVIDGVPVFERTGTVNIDIDNIESIKVIKGGASYLFGEDALSGAVVITTKRGAQYDGYTVNGEVGSFGAQKGMVRAGYANENGSGHVQVSHRKVDGYYDDSASLADYANGKLQYYLSDTSDISFGFEVSQREKNSHGSVKGETNAENDPMSTDPTYLDYVNDFDVNLAKYFVTYSNDLNDDANLMLNVYSYGDETAYLSRPAKPWVETYFGSGVYYQQDTLTGEYTYRNDYAQVQNGIKGELREAGETVAWMAGGELRRNNYKNESAYNIDTRTYARGGTVPVSAGELVSQDETDEAVNALYGELKVRVAEPLILTLNGRFDKLDYDYNDTFNGDKVEKSFKVYSWRAGANYALSDTMDIYGNTSTGFRAPTIKQLFSGDIEIGSEGTASNPDLEPETAVNLELGVRAKTQLFGAPTEIDATIFQITRDDYIMSTTGQYGAGDAGTTLNYYDNIGGMRNRGLELAVSSKTSNKFNWDLAYTYLDAKFTSYDNYVLALGDVPYDTGVTDRTGAYQGDCATAGDYDPSSEWCTESYDLAGYDVPRVPNHHINLTLNFTPDSHWTLSGEMDYQSSYYADELNWVKVDPRTIFNLVTRYDRKADNVTWSYYARIDNLFDTFYYNIARGHNDSNSDGVFDGEDMSIIVNQGRTFTMGLSANF